MSGTATARHPLVVGLGHTGLSLVRHLVRSGQRFAVADSRAEPPGLAELQRLAGPEVSVHSGPFDPRHFVAASELLVSPGVALTEPAILAARQHGIPVRSDIDRFRAATDAPLVAITGSNGKSTVTSLLGAMAEAVGVHAAVGGNLGPPALDLLDEAVELYILELSSFQLERCGDLQAEVATVLNVSPDHLDRHASLDSYWQVKRQVHVGARHIVVNRDDACSEPALEGPRTRFGLDAPAEDGDWGLRDGWLARGSASLLPVAELSLAGRHNLANALAALALGEALGCPVPELLEALRRFKGLPHRCQHIAELEGVDYYDDSKGTNVGATEAAIAGLAASGDRRLVLIAGGDGKGADFAPLARSLARYGRAAVLIGRDAPRLQAVLAPVVPVERAATMAEAVDQARRLARPGDAVLLSPACASHDMFADYRQRGRAFAEAVAQLQEEGS